jgi:8-oxo-dGTP diphosphatase
MKLLFENWRKFINEDSNYNVSEAKDINKIAKAIIVKDNKALILLRAGSEKNAGKWDLPGGHLNEGEDLMEGLLREVYEETGLKLSEPIENLYTKENTSFFKAEMPQEDINLSHEHTEYKFISLEEIPENISSRFVKAIKASL